MDRDILSNFNELLFKEWIKLPNLDQLTMPYLKKPSQEYCDAKIKFAVYDRETNGWGEKEREINPNFPASYRSLEDLYDNLINKDWENLGSVWPFYYSLRSLSEGCSPKEKLKGKVGFIQSNVALIGKPRNEYGYDESIINLLSSKLNEELKLLSPNIILFRIGFGTKFHAEESYLKILQKTFLGKLISSTPLSSGPSLFQLNFENNDGIKIFGCRHPQGFSYQPIVNEFEKLLMRFLKIRSENPSMRDQMTKSLPH